MLSDLGTRLLRMAAPSRTSASSSSIAFLRPRPLFLLILPHRCRTHTARLSQKRTTAFQRPIRDTMTDQRFVISARIVGGVHRDTPKLKMFMVSVLWSDEAEGIIYRSFQDFKEFHKSLKKKFPNLNPLRQKDKMIPKFRGKAIRSSLPKKGSKKSVQRMKFLESYCIKLLKCDQSVTQSSEVSRFFNPKNQDLQPDFTKNSVMILLSDVHPDGEGGVTHAAGNVTHPCITQTYTCVAPYETKDTKNRPFKVAMEEKLDVLIKDPTGWWLVENEEKRLAWFPAPYLDLWEGEDDDECTGFQLGGALYCAVRSYSSKKNDEVSVSIGTVVEVLRKSDNGWWLIRCNGKAGYIPSMYLQPYNNPRAGLYSVQQKMHSSTLNLATSRSSQALYQPSISEEINPEHESSVPSQRDHIVPRRMHKARSLDVLSEPWSQTQLQRVRPAPENDTRRLSSTSAATSFSDFSTSSDSSLPQSSHNTSQQPDDLSLSSHYISNSGSDFSESVSTKAGPGPSVAPRIPPRPKSEEIMTRCTTMTRKAAMATKTRLQIQPDYVHSR
uniref:NADPH oxidase organizer 1-like n=2 Tax=Gouania willdenowi TaxID=441366 RepID=A0A8C5DL67_GOUWI